MYYLPKLSEIQTNKEFKAELIYYFKIFIPIVIVILIVVYLLKHLIITIALTKEFYTIEDIVVWQLIGDFFKIMTLAFGYQLVIKMMIKKYIFVKYF